MRQLVLLTLAVSLLIGCQRSRGGERRPVEIETVDVDSGYDAELTTEADERARQVQIDLGGVLPSDFPAELPIFSPSSVVDFGPGYVEVDTPVPESEVRSSIAAQLERSGWTVGTIGGAGNTYNRDGVTVRIGLSAIGSGTRIRYEY